MQGKIFRKILFLVVGIIIAGNTPCLAKSYWSQFTMQNNMTGKTANISFSDSSQIDGLCLALSADGQRAFTMTNNSGYVQVFNYYTGNSYEINSNSIDKFDTSRTQIALDCSKNGQEVWVLAYNDSALWYSANYSGADNAGAWSTFQKIDGDYQDKPNDVAVNADGSCAYVITNGYICRYENHTYTGSHWSSQGGSAITCDASGNYVFVAKDSDLYVSVNSGVTFTKFATVPMGKDQFIGDIALSADGSTLFVAINNSTGTDEPGVYGYMGINYNNLSYSQKGYFYVGNSTNLFITSGANGYKAVATSGDGMLLLIGGNGVTP